MKRIYRFFAIQWDTDGVSQQTLNLPDSVDIEINDPEFDPEMEGADVLSDKFGFCVHGFNFQKVS